MVSPNNMNNHLLQTTASITNQLENVNDMIDILSGGTQVLNDDIQRLKKESVDRQNELIPLTRELLILKKSIEEQSTFIHDMKVNQEVSERDLPSAKQKLDNTGSTSYDGTLLWKIANVQEKMG
jgi:chromosome segregation ATPase